MTSTDLLRRPSGTVLAEQARAVSLALVREAMLAGGALALICFLALFVALRANDRLTLLPELLHPTLPVALLLPFAVWKGDPPFGRAFLWTLPVRRQHAAAAKVLAGALWLMVAMLVTLASLAFVSLATGGWIGAHWGRLVDTGSGEIATAAKVPWTTPFWGWVMPFTSALVLYTASSAAILGLRHPVRWVIGSIVAVTLAFTMAVAIDPRGLVEHGIDRFREMLWSGSVGLDFMLNGGEASLSRTIDRPGPGSDILWSALPEAGRWATATLFWFGLALLALALAIRRHWER
jgi:hypothetical protein